MALCIGFHFYRLEGVCACLKTSELFCYTWALLQAFEGLYISYYIDKFAFFLILWLCNSVAV